MPNLPGGKILHGFGGSLQISQVNTPSVFTTLNVASWNLHPVHYLGECSHSGTVGSNTRRMVMEDWSADVKLWWEADAPPELYLNTGWGVGCRFNISSPAQWAAYDSVAHYWYAPSAILETQDILNSSESKGKEGIVTVNAKLQANSLIFLLPTEQTQCDIYLMDLRGKGWIQ